jgi:hypothetical protein
MKLFLFALLFALSSPLALAARKPICETYLQDAAPELIRQFEKEGLPVSAQLTSKRLRQVKQSFGEERAMRILKEVEGVKGAKALKFASRLRGNATRIKITIEEVLPEGALRSPISVTRYAKANPRTLAGKETILTNVRILANEFSELVLLRAIENEF